MSKTKVAAEADTKTTEPKTEPTTTTASAGPPAGYQKRSSEVVGFYDTKTPIHVIPETVILADNKRMSTDEKPQISTLIICTLVDAATLVKVTEKRDSEGKFITVAVAGKPGDKVGIWYKVGMAGIKQLAGVPVYIMPAGKKDVGKPQAMDVFDCLSKETGEFLRVSQDRRKTTRNLPSQFPVPKEARLPTSFAAPADVGDDDIPF